MLVRSNTPVKVGNSPRLDATTHPRHFRTSQEIDAVATSTETQQDDNHEAIHTAAATTSPSVSLGSENLTFEHLELPPFAEGRDNFTEKNEDDYEALLYAQCSLKSPDTNNGPLKVSIPQTDDTLRLPLLSWGSLSKSSISPSNEEQTMSSVDRASGDGNDRSNSEMLDGRRCTGSSVLDETPRTCDSFASTNRSSTELLRLQNGEGTHHTAFNDHHNLSASVISEESSRTSSVETETDEDDEPLSEWYPHDAHEYPCHRSTGRVFQMAFPSVDAHGNNGFLLTAADGQSRTKTRNNNDTRDKTEAVVELTPKSTVDSRLQNQYRCVGRPLDSMKYRVTLPRCGASTRPACWPQTVPESSSVCPSTIVSPAFPESEVVVSTALPKTRVLSDVSNPTGTVMVSGSHMGGSESSLCGGILRRASGGSYYTGLESISEAYDSSTLHRHPDSRLAYSNLSTAATFRYPDSLGVSSEDTVVQSHPHRHVRNGTRIHTSSSSNQQPPPQQALARNGLSALNQRSRGICVLERSTLPPHLPFWYRRPSGPSNIKQTNTLKYSQLEPYPLLAMSDALNPFRARQQRRSTTYTNSSMSTTLTASDVVGVGMRRPTPSISVCSPMTRSRHSSIMGMADPNYRLTDVHDRPLLSLQRKSFYKTPSLFCCCS